VAEIVERLDDAGRGQIEAFRKEGRFFWIDLVLGETSRDELSETLGIPEPALNVLMSFGQGHPSSRRFHADGRHVAFAFTCYLESAQPGDGTPNPLQPIEVHLLVSGDYLLTIHEERVSLHEQLTPYMPEGRTEQYAVYAILDAMVASAFDALNEIEVALEDLSLASTNLRAGRVRMATARETSSRLSKMRRRVGPQRGLFERIGVELARVQGLEADEERYFDRIDDQVNRLVEAIDAASDSMARLIELRLNETSYWLTVVATVFLPLTFITGFFGMNFGWLVGEIDTGWAFLLLGVGTPVAAVVLVWRVVALRAPIESDQA
jgi:magnesium transporter